MAIWHCSGEKCLEGACFVQGAKNAVLPILAASVVCPTETDLLNVPQLSDVEMSLRILRSLGCTAQQQENDVYIDSRAMSSNVIPQSMMESMRSSVLFMGALLARCGEVHLTLPGGCRLGARPIDMHLDAMKALGASVEESGCEIVCRAEKLRGAHIRLPYPSVGATENAMIAACGAEGETVITGAAKEPEIEDLQSFLNACGGDVRGAGTSTVVIRGGRTFHGGTYRVMPDRIAAATYLCALASAGGTGFLRGAREEHLATVTAVLREAGCHISAGPEGIACACRERLRAVRPVRTAPYPGFPTDAQAVLMAALLRARGATAFEENIFENRYRHVDELARMGADIRVMGRVAVVTGVETLHGAPVRCTDLRGGAALCVAALAAEGESCISETAHIALGYEDIARDLGALGADIRWGGENNRSEQE